MDMMKPNENYPNESSNKTVENGDPGISKISEASERRENPSAAESMNSNGSNKRKLEQTDTSAPVKKIGRSEADKSVSLTGKDGGKMVADVDSVLSKPAGSRDRTAKPAVNAGISNSRRATSNEKWLNKGSQMEYEDGIVSKYIALTAVPRKLSPLPPLKNSEKKELETCLEIGREESWRDDWIGNLAFADKDVVNPDGKSRDKQKKPLFRWAEQGKNGLKILNNLMRFVFHLKETPPQAKKILANADPKSVASIQDAVRRVSYDPVVLREDGWTTEKSSEPIGASGGPHRIGEMVFWQGYEGVIIAYIHDHDLGDLWKAMWLEEFDTFDLEAEELDDAKRKYNRRMQRETAAQEGTSNPKNTSSQSSSSAVSKATTETTRRSGRNPSADFSVKGIEHGIVLAVSYSRGARPGVFWPARVMHFCEMKSYGSQTKRGSQKQKVDVVFLAPYWNAPPAIASGRRSESYAESLSRHGSSIFSSGVLFEVESIDASEDTIQEYPHDSGADLDIDQLRVSFKFAGLPKAAFSRYVDSHRLALGLRTYSEKVLKSTAITDLERTTAGLLEAHPMAAQAPSFPLAVLHIPFEHILSQLPALDRESSTISFDEFTANEEPALQLGKILDSMKPPFCWGMGGDTNSDETSSPEAGARRSLITSPPLAFSFDEGSDASPVTIDRFISDLSSLQTLLSCSEDESSMSCLLGHNLNQLLKKIPHHASEFKNLSVESKLNRAKALVKLWIVVKVREKSVYINRQACFLLIVLLSDAWRRVDFFF
jgi:hypothetical protein